MILSLAQVLRWERYAAARGVSEVARSERGFVRALERAGAVSRLPESWQRERENFIARHRAQVVTSESNRWLNPSGLPTDHALALIMWAFWPDTHRSDLRTASAALRSWERGDVSAKSPGGSYRSDLKLFLARCCAGGRRRR